jgi:copper(I)-binding protein
MKLKALLFASALICSVSSVQANIMTHHEYARATPPNAPTSAVFTQIMNSDDHDRFIVSAATSAAGKVELHDVIKEGDVMKMRQIERIKVPANGKVELKPGSLHIMLFELTKPFKEGENIDVELTFANGEKHQFTAPIKKVMSGMKHHH